MMVTASPSAKVRCTSAKCQPAQTSQITFPIKPRAPVPISSRPVSDLRSTNRRPNGQQEKLPNVKQARDQGRPIIVTAINTPTMYHQRQEIAPPNTNHRTFPRVFTQE